MHILDEEFRWLKKYMSDKFGINLEGKVSLIEGRLSDRLQNRGFQSFGAYAEAVMADKTGQEDSFLVSRLTTNYTYFLREEQHYSFMRATALPDMTKYIKDFDLRIWSAGCSSGEEPYTTAMVLMEYFGSQHVRWDTTVLGTDISEQVLSAARKGIYTVNTLSHLPDRWRQQYFCKLDDGRYQVSDVLRKQVVFGHFNLMDRTMPFKKKFHIIFCRNVMIYFDNPTREALTNRFYHMLEPGGYLFIGMSETMMNLKTPFEYVRPAIYRKGIKSSG